MVTPGQTRSEAFQWASLPAEIRMMILKTIARQKHRGWAAFASVCKEWQRVLEQANFRKLKLSVPCLDEFALVASPRRDMIRHIFLDIELPLYECPDCASPPTRDEDMSCNVSEAIWNLFDILSAWEPAGDLALELNVYSPSDREHWFKGIQLSSDDVDDGEESSQMPLDAWRSESRCHDPRHGWVCGRQVVSPPRSAGMRLYEPVDLYFDEPLPCVPSVTSFVMRRQLRRNFCLPGLKQVLKSLVRLEHLVNEPWPPSTASERLIREKALATLLRKSCPATLRSLTIFEDSWRFYNNFPRRPLDGFLLNPFPEGLRLRATMASRSRDLQHLCISFMLHAEHLLRHCRLGWNWPHLQSLVLTSAFLQDVKPFRPSIYSLLRRAAVVAQRMPELHTFVLWNGARGHAAAFIYRADRDGVSITWRATWPLSLSKDPLLLGAWRLVAARLPFLELRLRHQRIVRAICSHGDAIHYLKLPCQVIEPASLWQIRREAYSPFPRVACRPTR
ncbi:hypothetical protein J3F83DRAFT_768856 [Trichoderma novae-zelandiae]